MSRLELGDDELFGIANLPYGVFSTPDRPRARRIGVAIGDYVLDVAALAAPDPVLTVPTLNPLLAAGRPAWSALRDRLTAWLTDGAYWGTVRRHLIRRDQVRLHLPFEVADYVDFYASEQHATNLGRIFRPGQQPLTPNWKHLPIGYHGRAGTVVVSGTPIVRPSGQLRAGMFGPSRRLDIEAEVGFVVGAPTALGSPVALADFRDHVFGVCLVNDWSARDLQAFEYVPLGPFLGKSFATSVSPWVVPLDALRDAWVPPPPRDTDLLPYLDDTGAPPYGLDLTLEVRLNGETISRPPVAGMYWTAAQQLAHMTVNGAGLRAGDLFASGTVSGPGAGECGSLIELTWNGEQPLKLADGGTRTFLEDGDEVTITGTAPGPGGTRIGFGDVTGRITPGRPRGHRATAGRTADHDGPGGSDITAAVDRP